MRGQSTISNQQSTILRARYVFPVAAAPIPDGTVTVCGDRIVAVGPDVASAGEKVCDLGNVALLPGLVNAHVHLDFSDIAVPLGFCGIPFTDWIRRTIAYHQQAAGTNPQRSIELGLAESIQGGVTAVADIVQAGWSQETISDSPLNVTALMELIAPTSDRTAAAIAAARAHLCAAANRSIDQSWRAGLSPHAPYTVPPTLLQHIVAMSAEQHIPLAMHVAESREELEFLQSGTGPLRDLLEERGAWEPGAIPLGSRPMDYLRLLAEADRAIVIHGNYLDDEEIAFLARHAARMSIVYCPRSHDWFAFDPYPLRKLLSAGVAVALGTDGRGSTPDLSVLSEMRRAAEKHPQVGLDQILRMGTLSGAKALGLDERIGSLEPGKQADMTIVALPDHAAADPHELIMHCEQPVVGCYCRGRPLLSEK